MESKMRNIRSGMWFKKKDEYFYTALLIKKVEEKEMLRAILVTNKPSDGFVLEAHPVMTPMKTLEAFDELDGEEKIKFYEWMFEWILETKQQRKIRSE
jgi:hypothetical protein